MSTLSLGDICDFAYGDSLPEERRSGGNVPVYGSNGVVGWHDSAVTSGPTIVIGRKGSIGEIRWSDQPCFPIDTTYYVEATKLPCELRWLYYALLQLDLTRFNKSAAVPGLNREDAYEKRIVFPPLPEQRRIAAQLEAADRLRRTRRYSLELSDSFLPATFRQLFGGPREAMVKWPVLTLEECCKRVTDGTHLTPKFEASGVPFVFVKNISNGNIDFRTDKFVSESTFLELTRRCPIEENDVLYTIVGATYGQAVRVGRITKFTFQRHVAHIKPDSSIIEPGYLASIMQLPIVKQQADLWARGAAQPTINLKELKEFKIPVPPLAQQQHFATLVTQHERLRATQRESLRQAEHLFQTLLHRAFN